VSKKETTFRTCGDAHRFCKQFGLDVSIANDQLFDIADALKLASEKAGYPKGCHLSFQDADEFVDCVNQFRNDHRDNADDAAWAVNNDPMLGGNRVRAVLVNT
jgi:hypothetical protein